MCGNRVIRKLAAYVVVGINSDGLKNRGVKDILILCADGLTGMNEAIAAAFLKTEYQRCIVHQAVSYTHLDVYKRQLLGSVHRMNLWKWSNGFRWECC